MEDIKNAEVSEFRGEYRYLSNFVCPNPIVYKGITFKTVEHGYVYFKSKDNIFRKDVLNCKTAWEVKKLGGKVELRKDFDFIKLYLMYSLVCNKFKNNPDLLYKLKTIKGDIIEGNYWHDNYWGDCRCNKCKVIMGENNLGKILMYIRDNVEYKI